jgi:23S rRNA (guanosine2251-2'-O)-methyltransferase
MKEANESGLLVKNPHSILAALKMRPKDVLEITFPNDKSDGVWDEIDALVERHRIRTSDSGGSRGSDSRRRDARPQKASFGRESGHGASLRPKPMTSVEKLFEDVDASSRGVWLALDCLQDPQNLGAIFRSAAFFGIQGIIMTSERSAPMTSTVYDISTGGVEAIPFVAVPSLQRAFEKAKDAGLWILGTSEHAKTPIHDIEKDRPWLVVMGNEEKGIRRLTEETCDVMCTIPNRGEGVTSLNVSVATGIMLSFLS